MGQEEKKLKVIADQYLKTAEHKQAVLQTSKWSADFVSGVRAPKVKCTMPG